MKGHVVWLFSGASLPISEANRVLLDAGNELGVDVDGAKVVDQDTHPQTVLPVENAIEQRRFPGTEEASQKRDRDRITSRYD